jgi:hypothetical protein
MATQSNQNQRLSHEIIHKELDLIQEIVKRMATNSFQVKAWLIGILSALVVIESKSLFIQANADQSFSMKMNIFLFLPILCFWYLDAFFLSTERLYRELYKWVVKNRKNTDAYLYNLNTFSREEFDEQGIPKIDANNATVIVDMLLDKNSIGSVMMSKTLILFYITPILFVLGLLFYNFVRT